MTDSLDSKTGEILSNRRSLEKTPDQIMFSVKKNKKQRFFFFFFLNASRFAAAVVNISIELRTAAAQAQ